MAAACCALLAALPPSTHTIATPATTTAMDPMMGVVNLRFSQTASTQHTNGMINSLAICRGKEEA